MNGGGPGSGIWKSTDGGETWTRSQAAASRRPARPHRGRRLPQAAEHPVLADRRADAAGRPRRRRRPRRRGRRPRRGGPAAPQGGGGAAPRRRRHPADRALSLRRRRRDLAQGEQRQPAPDVLQPGAHRPERSGARLLGGVGLHMTHRRRQDVRHRRRPRHARRRARDLDRSGQLRTTCMIGNDGGLAVSYDMSEDVDVHRRTCRSGCSTT